MVLRPRALAMWAGAVVTTVAVAPVLSAAPGEPAVPLTSQQLSAAGFTVAPNTKAWGAPVTMSAVTGPVWQDLTITGQAPDSVPIGQILTMERFYATGGPGAFKPLNITAVVGANRRFVLHFQFGYPGLWGYRVGYQGPGARPEFIGFEFQFTTTGKGKPAPPADALAVSLSPKRLARAGFTAVPNVSGWGGTAKISATSAPAGTPVLISGRAPGTVKPGQLLTLNRFIATDTRGSGHFEVVPGVLTTVRDDGTYAVQMELNEPGLSGYSLGIGVGQQWVGIEFQLETTERTNPKQG